MYYHVPKWKVLNLELKAVDCNAREGQRRRFGADNPRASG